MKRRIRSILGCLALTFLAGLTFVPMGCGGSFKPPQEGNADGAIPEEVARQIRTCAAKYMGDLPPHDQTISFEVKLASDGEVDSIALHSSTVSHESLEACMAKAIRKLSEDQLSLRGSRRRGELTREQGRFLGQEEIALGCFASPPCLLTVGFIIGATYLVVALYVQTATKVQKPEITKDECVEQYVRCTELPFKQPCGQCLNTCTARKEWPKWQCPN